MTGAAAWLSAADAARRMGVSRATLYAYVSRGFIRSQPAAGSRERQYSRDDVERMRRRAEARRAPETVAARALEWGMPVLESAITLIDGATMYYRGHDAVALSRARSLEDVAALVWTGRFDALPQPPSLGRLPAWQQHQRFVVQAQMRLAWAVAHDPLAVDVRPPRVVRTGMRIVQLLTAAATGSDTRREPAHVALARAWRLDGRAAHVLRAALVLCADHELNVSSFTARCVASAGSHPYAVVMAGLAALEGPRHGGASARASAMLQSLRRARRLDEAIAGRLGRGESIDGFGHPLYRNGDPRARVLLQMLADCFARSAEYRFVRAFARAATRATGDEPNLDFALASVARVLELPVGSPLMIFAIGRSVGWIGHAMEQYATGQLIRPRAKYVGPTPGGSESS